MWKRCTAGIFFTGYDPPKTLEPASVTVSPVTTPNDPMLETVMPSPAPTHAQPPAETKQPQLAPPRSTLQSSSTRGLLLLTQALKDPVPTTVVGGGDPKAENSNTVDPNSGSSGGGAPDTGSPGGSPFNTGSPASSAPKAGSPGGADPDAGNAGSGPLSAGSPNGGTPNAGSLNAGDPGPPIFTSDSNQYGSKAAGTPDVTNTAIDPGKPSATTPTMASEEENQPKSGANNPEDPKTSVMANSENPNPPQEAHSAGNIFPPQSFTKQPSANGPSDASDGVMFEPKKASAPSQENGSPQSEPKLDNQVDATKIISAAERLTNLHAMFEPSKAPKPATGILPATNPINTEGTDNNLGSALVASAIQNTLRDGKDGTNTESVPLPDTYGQRSMIVASASFRQAPSLDTDSLAPPSAVNQIAATGLSILGSLNHEVIAGSILLNADNTLVPPPQPSAGAANTAPGLEPIVSEVASRLMSLSVDNGSPQPHPGSVNPAGNTASAYQPKISEIASNLASLAPEITPQANMYTAPPPKISEIASELMLLNADKVSPGTMYTASPPRISDIAFELSSLDANNIATGNIDTASGLSPLASKIASKPLGADITTASALQPLVSEVSPGLMALDAGKTGLPPKILPSIAHLLQSQFSQLFAITSVANPSVPSTTTGTNPTLTSKPSESGESPSIITGKTRGFTKTAHTGESSASATNIGTAAASGRVSAKTTSTGTAQSGASRVSPFLDVSDLRIIWLIFAPWIPLLI